MFLIELTYQASDDVVRELRTAHYAHIDQYFAAGTFVFGCRRVPSTGGVILAHDVSRNELCAILDQDPFVRSGAATYDLVELAPMRARPELARALGLDPDPLRPGA